MAQNYYHDDFNNGVVDLSVDSPNGRGTVSESTTLLIQANSGQDCDWWYSVSRRGALAYVPLPSLSKITKWYCEIDVAAINCPGNSYAYLCCLVVDGTRHMWIGTQGTGPSYTFYCNYWNNNDTSLGNFTSTLPVKLRLVWDRSAGTAVGQYWGGSDWVQIGSALSLPWTPIWFGAGCKNWSGFPQGNANLSMMDVTYDTRIGYLRDGRDLNSRDRDAGSAEGSAGLLDSLASRTLSGLQQHDQPRLGQGYIFSERNGSSGGTPASPAIGGAGSGVSDSLAAKTLSLNVQHDQPRMGKGAIIGAEIVNWYVGSITNLGGTPNRIRLNLDMSRFGTAYFSAGEAITIGSAQYSEYRGTYVVKNVGPTYLDIESPYTSSGWLYVQKPSRAEAGIFDSYLVHLQNADFQLGGVDAEGHSYFTGYDLKCIRFVDSTNEPWNSPTAGGFTGYARNGKKYTNGIEDAGPVWAPWASEATSGTRGSRDDFPIKAAIVVTNQELVIFDLDAYPAVTMWMRFPLNSSSDAFYMAGSTQRWPTDVHFWSGKLIWVSGRSGSSSYCGCIDFTATAAPMGYLVGPATYIWPSGKTIVNRAETDWTVTGAPSFGTIPDTTYRACVPYHDGTYFWIAVATDSGPYVIRTWDYLVVPQGNLVGACRGVCFDRAQAWHGKDWARGVLFYSIGSVIYRNRLEYKTNGLITEMNTKSPIATRRATNDRVDLGYGITVNYLASGGPYIYAATNRGVFRIRQDTLAAELLYSVGASSGGMGTFKTLSGGNPDVPGLRVFTIGAGVFLGVARPAVGHLGGEIALIRDKDNKIIRGYRYPAIWSDGSGVLDMLTY